MVVGDEELGNHRKTKTRKKNLSLTPSITNPYSQPHVQIPESPS